MADDQVELLILAGVILVMMLVLALLKLTARKQGLDKLGKRFSRRVIRARKPTDDEHP